MSREKLKEEFIEILKNGPKYEMVERIEISGPMVKMHISAWQPEALVTVEFREPPGPSIIYGISGREIVVREEIKNGYGERWEKKANETLREFAPSRYR